jgi:hypothetical protein
VETKVGIKRAMDREKVILSFLSLPERKFWFQWTDLLKSVNQDYIHLDLFEIGQLMGYDEAKETVLDNIMALDTNDGHRLRLCYDFLFDSSEKDVWPFMLRGYGFIRPVPWDKEEA